MIALMNVWSTILIASVAIGLFLLSVLLAGHKANARATYLFCGLLSVLIATNFDNWLFASGVWLDLLRLTGFSRASILLIGPIIALYARSVVEPEFRLRPVDLLHLVPYAVSYGFLFPALYLSDPAFKREYIRLPLESEAQMWPAARFLFTGYLVHLSSYLVWTIFMIRREISSAESTPLIVPKTERLQWLRRLAIALVLFLVCLALPLSWSIVTGTYHPQINFALTILYSLLIYYLGISVIRNEEVVLPDFARKYSTLSLPPDLETQLAAKVVELFDNQKIYLDPNLSLQSAADRIGTPPGYLSRHINVAYKQSFPDYVNTCRVTELRRRLTDPAFQHLTILGLAMEVGFRSKSSFNAAFKKVTGQSPSDFKKSQN
jgi:AraC-like DNA-binding protein